MDESEWLVSDDPPAMLKAIGNKPNERKLRLYSCGCVRAVWSHLKDDRSRAVVELGERHADDTVLVEVRREAIDAAYQAAVGRRTWAVWSAMSTLADHHLEARRCAPRRTGADLLRDIFGNPFRPVTFSPAWRSETVVALASGIYAERAFDRMPILADALEEAGCDHADVLSHCRGPGPHTRGCWVVDGVLGKS